MKKLQKYLAELETKIPNLEDYNHIVSKSNVGQCVNISDN